MSLLKKNLVANLAGSACMAILSFAFVPFYIHFLGIESFGLVGFFVTLQAILTLLDMGLSATVSRELARLSVGSDTEQRMRDLVSTLEVVYLLLAACVIIMVFVAAPFIAEKWLRASTLSSADINQAVILMGLVIGIRLPVGLYYGGLQGLQRLVMLNTVKVITGFLQSGGVVLVLWLVSPSITAFFGWQIAIGLLGTGILALTIRHCLPGKCRGRIQPSLVLSIWRFAAGMSLISVLSVILVQMDKVVVSRMLSLENFAYYALASSVAMGLYYIISPVFSALYPRLTQLVAGHDEAELKALYHKSCQLMTILVAPLALTLAMFSFEILLIWTRNEMVAENSAPILSILVIGTAVNGMVNIPYALQLAHGWTRLAIYSNIATVVLLVPMLIYMVTDYGAIGAAAVWLILNTVYVAFNAQITHRKLLPGEFLKWLVFDLGLPSVAVFMVVLAFTMLMPAGLGFIGQTCWILLALSVALVSCVIAAPAIRFQVRNLLATRFWLQES